MKILHLSDYQGVEYLSDLVLHGGRQTFGADYVDFPQVPHMYKSFPSEKSYFMYGRGFTIARRLDDIEIDRNDIMQKISDKFFDVVIFASHISHGFADGVINHMMQSGYTKKNMVFLDDHDMPERFSRHFSLYGSYFKRENNHNTPSYIIPIGYAVPEEMYIEKPNKENKYAYVLPYRTETYIFNDEQSYYADYAKSYFGITMKKAGWDCLRHYEILANYCMPLFYELNQCPTNIMHRFPKEMLQNYLRTIEKPMSEISIWKDRNEWPDIEITDDYNNTMKEMWEYGRKNLTTKNLINYILSKI
jgi:hypothetical protein